MAKREHSEIKIFSVRSRNTSGVPELQKLVNEYLATNKLVAKSVTISSSFGFLPDTRVGEYEEMLYATVLI